VKVCWLSKHISTPQQFLSTIIKMTPGRRGVWKNMEAITDPNKADFVLVMDDWTGSQIPLERTIFFAEHPRPLPAYRTYEELRGRALLCLPLDKFLNPGEWWIDHDYDYLTALKPPKKPKRCACVFTAKTGMKMYADRIRFMTSILPKFPEIDLFGRPERNFQINPILLKHYRGRVGARSPRGSLGEHMSGKEMLVDYRYTLEFDNGPTRNYFSERFYDSMLLWCMPIYWGSKNVHDYLPAESFRYVDIEAADASKEADRVVEIIRSDSYEQHLQALAQAREMLLNRWQLWPYLHHVVNNLDEYREAWKV